jgi:hypothetical protein
MAGVAGLPPGPPAGSPEPPPGGDGPSSWLERAWPPLVVAAVTAAAWLLLAPWDWSTVDAQGKPLDTQQPWTALLLVAVVSGLAVAAVVRRQPAAVLSAPLAGLVTMAVLYSWRASQARVSGTNLWVFGLIGVVLPLGLLGTFGGAWLALRSLRRQQDQ